MIEKLGPNHEQLPFSQTSIDHAYFGPWVPVSSVEKDGQPLHKALKPHVYKIPEKTGVPSVPTRLVNALTKQDGSPKPK